MSLIFIFFFQAEDGIRDTSVTGVQTCALPISITSAMLRLLLWTCGNGCPGSIASGVRTGAMLARNNLSTRSEERRVGKECRARGAPEHVKEENNDESSTATWTKQ